MGENEEILQLQEEYIAGNKNILSSIYELLQVMAYKVINTISNSDPRVKELKAEDRRRKAHDAATYIVEQYIARPQFRMERPYKYVKLRVLHELYYHRKCDSMLEYSDEIPERASGKKYSYIVENELTQASATYETLQEVMSIFPKIRKDKLRACINKGETYKRHKITVIELEG